jgi:transcriptional regulator with XRE-family HTH domain
MEPTPDPAVQRRRLIVELRRARVRAGFTQKQVAEELDWSLSKLLRIESGQIGISTTDLRALLDHYGIHDAAQRSQLVTLAQHSRRQTWTEFRDVLHPDFMVYLRYESAAALIRDFNGTFVPGLLQTEEYARAVIRTLTQDESEIDIDRQVQVRMRRQEILDRADPPRLHFILDESVIRRRIGGTRVMRRQLIQLKALAERSHVTIQILPFSFGSHLGMSGYKNEFFRLESTATAAEGFARWIDRALDEMT